MTHYVSCNYILGEIYEVNDFRDELCNLLYQPSWKPPNRDLKSMSRWLPILFHDFVAYNWKMTEDQETFDSFLSILHEAPLTSSAKKLRHTDLAVDNIKRFVHEESRVMLKFRTWYFVQRFRMVGLCFLDDLLTGQDRSIDAYCTTSLRIFQRLPMTRDFLRKYVASLKRKSSCESENV